MTSMLRFCPLLLLIACQSYTWRADDPLHGTRWRDRHAFVTEHDVVLARHESSAAQTADAARDLREAAAEHLGTPLGPILWIAMGPDEDALAEDLDSFLDTLRAGVPRRDGDVALDRRLPFDLPTIGGGKSKGRNVRAPTAAERQRMEQTATRALTFRLEPSSPALAIPADLAARVRHVVLYPTDDGLEVVAEELIEGALDLCELSFFESAMVAIARGSVTDAFLAKLVEVRQAVLLEFATAGLDRASESYDQRRTNFADVLGVPVRPTRDALRRDPSMTEFMASPLTVFPDDATLHAIAWPDTRIRVALGERVDTMVIVRNDTPFRDLAGVVPGVIVLVCKGEVGRADLDELFDRLGQAHGRVVVQACNRELAATIATLHEVERLGLSAIAARELWAEYGMPAEQDLDYASLRRYLRTRPSD